MPFKQSSKLERSEVDVPDPIVDFLQSDIFPHAGDRYIHPVFFPADAAIGALEGLRDYAWAAEEPVSARDWKGLEAVGAQTGMTIILDESVTRLKDLSALGSGATYILNARVSKHGGLLRTLEIIRAARDRGIKIIVGAQVGETSILARAGIVAARAAGADLVAYEGAFGTRLLVRDAVMPSIGFGYRGRIALGACSGAGLGLTPTAEVAEACR